MQLRSVIVPGLLLIIACSTMYTVKRPAHRFKGFNGLQPAILGLFEKSYQAFI